MNLKLCECVRQYECAEARMGASEYLFLCLSHIGVCSWLWQVTLNTIQDPSVTKTPAVPGDCLSFYEIISHQHTDSFISFFLGWRIMPLRYPGAFITAAISTLWQVFEAIVEQLSFVSCNDISVGSCQMTPVIQAQCVNFLLAFIYPQQPQQMCWHCAHLWQQCSCLHWYKC